MLGIDISGPGQGLLYKQAVDNSPDSAYWFDSSNRFVYINQTGCRVLGYSLEELVGQDLSLVSPNVTPERLAQVWAILRKEGSFYSETVHRRKDGSFFPVEIMSVHVEVEGRELICGFARDITERKQREHLLVNRLKLRDYADSHSLDELIQFTLDMAESVTDSRIGFFHFIDENQKDLKLQTWSTNTLKHMCGAKTRGAHYPIDKAGIWMECFHSRKPVIHNDYENTPHRKGLPPGHAAVVRELTYPVIRHGKVEAVAGVGNKPAEYGESDVRVLSDLLETAWDIIFRKRTEEEMERLQSEKEFAQRMKTLGVFAGGIAHDFNNMLAVVFGNIELAKMSTRERDVVECLDSSSKAIVRAKSLSRQLLTFAKGGAPVMTEADLLPVIREVGEFALSGSRCTAEYDLPPRSVFCLFDPNQIGQVVENLMINSRQSMPDGGRISVSVSVVTLKETEKAGLQGGEYARIIFKDEGVGIPADALPRVFDPYFTTKQTGSGLGLATVWSIIKRHNGHIEIESSVGSGTTVTVFLPVTGHESKRNDDRLLTDSHGTGRILLMDDEEALLAYSLKVLSGAGFKPEGAGNGAEALRLFRKAWEEKASYKAVILDLTVPGGMNGVEVAEEIRKIDGTVPLLVVSGYSDDPVVANPSVYGFAASLSKPYQPKELIRLVNGVLSASG